VTVLPDPHLRRAGRDIELTLPLTLAEACLGTHVDVPTVDGSVRLTIPGGTSSGAKLRLRGKGVKGQDGARGDQFCRIEVVVPKLDPADKEGRRLVEELDRRAKTAIRGAFDVRQTTTSSANWTAIFPPVGLAAKRSPA
jgi:DnaJ-class molecular chaperone